VITAAGCLMNVQSLYFDPPDLWARVSAPALMFVGLAGSVWPRKILRFAGWLGIGFFALVILGVVIPGEDLVLRHMANSADAQLHLVPDLSLPQRIAIVVGFTSALVFCFIWSGKQASV
jgi:hypothetical protein